MTERDPQPGLRARTAGWCGLCPEPIRREDRFVYRRGIPVHVEHVAEEVAE